MVQLRCGFVERMIGWAAVADETQDVWSGLMYATLVPNRFKMSCEQNKFEVLGVFTISLST